MSEHFNEVIENPIQSFFRLPFHAIFYSSLNTYHQSYYHIYNILLTTFDVVHQYSINHTKSSPTHHSIKSYIDHLSPTHRECVNCWNVDSIKTKNDRLPHISKGSVIKEGEEVKY